MRNLAICVAMVAVSVCSECKSECFADEQKRNEAVVDKKEKGFARGADVSWVTEMENKGMAFYAPGEGRKKMECMQLLKECCGVNSIRLRVWVNPAERWNGIEDVVVKARRAERLGLRTMIDFHFSDSWADPGKQRMPAAWEKLHFEELKAAVAAHVKETLGALKAAGVMPEWVQIGNETTPGMMLPVGDIKKNPAQYAALNNAGYDAAKSVFPKVKCIVHLDNGNDQGRYDRMFDALEAHGGRYDMIGMSVYPYWAAQSGDTGGWEKVAADVEANIAYLKSKFRKPVMICEIGMPYNEAETCKRLIARMMKADVEGVFYWEPQAPAGYNGGYTMGCFENGAPTVALSPFVDGCK